MSDGNDRDGATSKEATAPGNLWPEGKDFAFTIFDDPDGQTVEMGRAVYGLLADLGMRTTKGVWPLGTDLPPGWGGSCEDDDYREWCQSLHARGFEIGYHNARQVTSSRLETTLGLDRFKEVFGHGPTTMAQHYNCLENIYWGEKRVSGLRRGFYNLATRGKHRNRYFGDVENHAYFWGDVCRSSIKYVRNFVFADINTLSCCPAMPYHDAQRPFVNAWFASSEGANIKSFTATLSEKNQDRLVEQRGACIMYTHFGHGFVEDGELDRRFRDLMSRLADLNGWFVPVCELLDRLRGVNGTHELSDSERARLERRWLRDKIRRGTS